MTKKKRHKKTKRITNRQAKIARKKKKVKQAAKYPKLESKVKDMFKQQGLSGNPKFIDDPDGVKMSAVVLKLADPLLKKYGINDRRIETIIALTVIEWNKLMYPKSEHEKLHDMTIDRLVPEGGDAEDIGSLLYVSELIAERKKKYFPNLKTIIINYDLSVSNGNITLNVSSAPIESEPNI